MTPNDWRAFGDALTVACPDAVYLRKLSMEQSRGLEPANISLERHLADCTMSNGNLSEGIRMNLNPDVEPELVQGNFNLSIHGNYVYPGVTFYTGGGIHPESANRPEHIREGKVQISCELDNKGHVRFAQQIFRLLGKFVTNKNTLVLNYPSYEPQRKFTKGFYIWFGHDALRWAREDPRRLLAFSGSWQPVDHPEFRACGCRPNDDNADVPEGYADSD